MDVDFRQLPVPDWGLVCPRCSYPLVGLPDNRCPECGTTFDVPSLIRSWTRMRAPRYTGREFPVPDFGLRCSACGAALCGSSEPRCPGCGAAFELAKSRPRDAWFVVDPHDVPAMALEALLADALIPYLRQNPVGAVEVYMGSKVGSSRLLAPAEFYFDVLALVQQARRSRDVASEAAQREWTCAGCGAGSPDHFEICWQCGMEKASDPGRPDE